MKTLPGEGLFGVDETMAGDFRRGASRDLGEIGLAKGFDVRGRIGEIVGVYLFLVEDFLKKARAHVVAVFTAGFNQHIKRSLC